MLQRLADAGLVKGKTVGIDATTLEANACCGSAANDWSGRLRISTKPAGCDARTSAVTPISLFNTRASLDRARRLRLCQRVESRFHHGLLGENPLKTDH
jgi:hypothetical protein